VALLLWIGGWLLWRWWRSGKSVDWATPYLPQARLRWLAPLMALIGVGAFIALLFHPMMPIFLQLLWKVFFA
ncbi:DedA family protein, partial [Pantoea sp. R102]